MYTCLMKISKRRLPLKKRDLSREELERGKVWNITTQRYRSKITTEQAYKSGLLYLAPLNFYLDYSKIKTRCFHPQDEIRSGTVRYVNGKYYTYRFKPDKEKKLNFTYHPGTNTYTTPPVERKSTSPLDLMIKGSHLRKETPQFQTPHLNWI